ncbi:GGDEF domain-containing protein [Salipiger bermudensis]|uniref:GGDEF domain-containing protein n=1 Tax=Salipiger bermudensis TaxID=344736 RepID=UPI001CD79537|nr:GGDEF domain-containing protein [Salipiger bermudensis]MCA1286834.1 GGDEF domain-containing protein [Salipiger bermudensis]
MSLPAETMATLMPLHMAIGADGQVVSLGPTLAKVLGPGAGEGAAFTQLVEIYRPRAVATLPVLLSLAGRKLQLRLRGRAGLAMKGLAMPDGRGGAVLNLSFGIGVVEAVRRHALTSSDFAATDLAIDMLYLVEAKSAAMESSRTLNRRLQGAMQAAEQRAFTDPLTGLGNRRAMDQLLQRLIRGGERFAVLHLDLDHFKQVNDSRGHAAGDRVLQAVARTMLDLTRKNDLVARIGGDEFVILPLGLTDHERLSDLARQLIARIEEPVPIEDGACQVSASIGIALHDPDNPSPAGVAGLLAQADSALYAAKREGRSRHAFHRAEAA